MALPINDGPLLVPKGFNPDGGVVIPKASQDALDHAIQQQVFEINKHIDSFMRTCFSLVLPEEIIAIFDQAESQADLTRNGQLVNMLGLRTVDKHASQLEPGVYKSLEIIRIPRHKKDKYFVIGKLKILKDTENEHKIRLESEVNRNCDSIAYTIWTPVIRQWLRKLAGTGNILANAALAKRPGFKISDGELSEQGESSGEQQREETDRGSGEGIGTVSVSPDSLGAGNESPMPKGTCHLPIQDGSDGRKDEP